MGQIISLTDVGEKYEIYVVDGMPLLVGYKVMEVGSDFLLVEDTDGLNEIRNPRLLHQSDHEDEAAKVIA